MLVAGDNIFEVGSDGDEERKDLVGGVLPKNMDINSFTVRHNSQVGRCVLKHYPHSSLDTGGGENDAGGKNDAQRGKNDDAQRGKNDAQRGKNDAERGKNDAQRGKNDAERGKNDA